MEKSRQWGIMNGVGDQAKVQREHPTLINSDETCDWSAPKSSSWSFFSLSLTPSLNRSPIGINLISSIISGTPWVYDPGFGNRAPGVIYVLWCTLYAWWAWTSSVEQNTVYYTNAFSPCFFFLALWIRSVDSLLFIILLFAILSFQVLYSRACNCQWHEHLTRTMPCRVCSCTLHVQTSVGWVTTCIPIAVLLNCP